MDAIECIMTRRSVRNFKDKKISESVIKKIIEAGMYAPSAGNEQPWHFIIITDKNVLNEIPKICPYASMAKDSQVSILVCGDIKLEKYKGFWVQDCSASMLNLLLAAHALGLGAVWTGVYPVKDIIRGLRKLLNIPSNVTPLGLIPIGYPDEKPENPVRFKKERVHYNKW